jgi:Tfp pilus assembly protein PilF
MVLQHMDHFGFARSAPYQRRCYLPWIVTLIAGAPTGAQVDPSNQAGPSVARDVAPGSTSAESAAPTVSASSPTSKSDDVVTINGSMSPLPKLPPDEFTDCMRQGPRGSTVEQGATDLLQLRMCQAQIHYETKIVIEACVNDKENTGLQRVIQACTELLDRNLFEGRDRFSLFANRARAYFALGDKAQALEDYNKAVALAPHNADLYYARGLIFAAQSNYDAALRDFDTAIESNSKSTQALRQRARVYQHLSNFSSSLADYAEAIRLEPRNAALWSERGYVCMREHDYSNAVKNEDEAIRLDPKLAWAFFLRGAAFGNMGDSQNASSDIKTAVGLDPSLAKYVLVQGKTASLSLPPPPN